MSALREILEYVAIWTLLLLAFVAGEVVVVLLVRWVLWPLARFFWNWP